MFTFGTDPEFMIADSHGNIRSAIGIVNGDRSNRIRKGNCSFYYDNVLAECTVKPAATKEEAVENIREAIRLYKEVLGPNFRLLSRASQSYDHKELDTGKWIRSPLGGMVKEGRYAGCKTEKCAYELEEVDPEPIQLKIRDQNLRTAGGHIHLGTDLGKSYLQAVSLVRMMDLFVGLPALILDHDPTSPLRRKLYGQAGRFRQPKWGLEYRTLGNFWLSSPNLAKIIYELTNFAVEFVESGKHQELWTIDEDGMTDEFFNNGGNPADLHTCHRYDPNKFRKLFNDFNQKVATDFINLIFSYLPSHLCNNIIEEANKSPTFDLYKEWNV